MIRWSVKSGDSTHTVYNCIVSCKLIRDMKPEMHKLTNKEGKETWFGYVNGQIIPGECPEFRHMSKTIGLFIQEQIKIECKKVTKELSS